MPRSWRRRYVALARRPARRLTIIEQLKANKWWERERLEKGRKWTSLEHNGVQFPPFYVPHGVPLIYDGARVELDPESEEVAGFFARVPDDGPQLGSKPEIATIFKKNFFDCFLEVLPRDSAIRDMDKCNFSLIKKHLDGVRDAEKERKAGLSKDQKATEKATADTAKLPFLFAMVDKRLQRVGNTMAEPPGLFMGRGLQPKTGTLKKRVYPEMVSINSSQDGQIPSCPMPGHCWGSIVYRPDATWLAKWNENVQNSAKRVYLAAASEFKGQSDRDKYQKARKLQTKIVAIRADYEACLSSDVDLECQLAVCTWVIDRLSLRVGGEKSDDEADTVGCCTLRVEHVTLAEKNNKHRLKLDFLGKDSMRHEQTYDLDAPNLGGHGKSIYDNFKKFVSGKSPDEQVFDRIKPTILNEHLKKFMPGLSAKVFRTYNASVTLQRELSSVRHLSAGDPVEDKLEVYNAANRRVALLCNHQKTVTKSAEATLDKMDSKVESLKAQISQLKKMLKLKKSGKDLKSEGYGIKEADDKIPEHSHKFTKEPSEASVQRRLESFEGRLKKQETNARIRHDNKTVALGTSKINYMDPRITVAFAKRVEMPIEKVFPKTLCDKFNWAMSAPSTFTW